MEENANFMLMLNKKKYFLNDLFNLILLLAIMAVCSCSNHVSSSSDESDSLKSIAVRMDEECDWSSNEKEQVLEEDFSDIAGLSSGVDSSLVAVVLSRKESDGSRNYPVTADGFSLDVSDLPEVVAKCAGDFAADLEKGGNGEEFFSKENIYSLVIFLYDYHERFGNRKITRHVVGKPFVDKDYWQVPVRMYFSRGKARKDESGDSFTDIHEDVLLYIRQFDTEMKIFEIEFDFNEPKD